MKKIVRFVLYFFAWCMLFSIGCWFVDGIPISTSPNSSETYIPSSLAMFVGVIFASASITCFEYIERVSKKNKNASSETDTHTVANKFVSREKQTIYTPEESIGELSAKGVSSQYDIKKLPSAKKCRQIADEKVRKAEQYIASFHNGKSIHLAVKCAEEVRKLLTEGSMYEAKAIYYNPADRPSYILNTFREEFQWKLRDVIEREEAYRKQEMKGVQRNNKRDYCGEFYKEIQFYKHTFSEETLDFAMDAYFRVCEFAGLAPQTQGEIVERKLEVTNVDGMDGHSFEEYCTDLLRKNGYKNVVRTKGSGDQGVDILAEKDDIKYAIQCKCYSSDLGNKPIQEVFAGKSIYNCHVACVMTNRYFTSGGIEASKATGVLLWDRRKLQELIENANKT